MRKRNDLFPKGVSGSVSKSENDHFGMWDRIFFFVEKKLTLVFFGVKFTGDYLSVAVIPILFRDHRQKSTKPNFSSFFDFWTWSRNNYVMIPTTCQFPVNFTPKNCTSKLNCEKKKIFDSRKGFQVRSQNRKTTISGCRTEFFFVEKKVNHIVFCREIYRRSP